MHHHPSQRHTGPERQPERCAATMTAPGPTDLDQVLHLEMTDGWTRRERVRILWYRPRLTVLEMSYATRPMAEL